MKVTSSFVKISAALLTLSLLGGVFTGCGGTNGNSSAAPAASTAPTSTTESAPPTSGKIRIAWWGNQLRNDTTMAMLDAYTAENKGVTFEAEFSDWSGYWDKLATQAASSNLPDIFQQDYSYISQYYARGQLANLTELSTQGHLNLDDVNESILASGTFDGKLYALCSGMNALCTVYDEDVLVQAGVTMPERPSYQDIMDISATVFEKTGIKGETPGGYGAICMMARDHGQMIFDVENSKLGITEDIAKMYFDQVKTTIDSPWALTVDVMQEASTAGLEAQPIAIGKSCYNFPGGSNMIAALQKASKHKLKAVMYPRSDGYTQESMYLRPAMFFSIAESSTNKEMAAKVIDFYTNSEKAQDCLMAERGVPVSSKMAEYLRPKLDEVQQYIFEYIAKVEKVAVPFDPPLPNGASEANKLLDDLTDLIRYGEITPDEAVARYIPEANAILAKANAA